MKSTFNECLKDTKELVPFINGQRKGFVEILSAKCNRKGIPMNEAKILIKKEYNFDDEKVTGIIEKSYANTDEFGKEKKPTVESYLNSKYDFRYNEVTGRMEYKKHNAKNYISIRDYELNSLYRELNNNGFRIGTGRLEKLLISDFVDEFNPFKEYFNNLPEWDGKDYILELSKMVKTDDERFWQIALKKWLVGMVATTIKDNGKKNHTVIVLSGEQGIGKSTFIGRLLPPELRKYKYSGLINLNNRDSYILMTENIIIDLDEMASLNRKEEKSLKEIITKPNVKIRRPYGRVTEDLPRRASFIGSINDHQFLTDLTGSRRFLSFEVSKFDIETPINYEGLYSQLMYLYKSDFNFCFEGEENDEINQRNEKFRIKSDVEELILSKYTPCTKEETTIFKTATEILNDFRSEFGIQMGISNSIQLGKVMKKYGFEQVKKTGVNKYALKINNSADLPI